VFSYKLLVPRQREITSGPDIDFSFRPDASTVPMDNPMRYPQPDARSFKFRFCVQTLENLKQLLDIPHVKTDPVIPNAKNIRIPILMATDFNFGKFPGAGEFDRTSYQVHHHLMQHGRIAAGFGKRLQNKIDVVAVCVWNAFVVRVPGQFSHIQFQEAQRLTGHPAKGKQIVHQLPRPPRLAADDIQGTLARIIKG
jgi:uncharacterized spore protein YtfJ